jgi:hypothetical protein
MIAGGRKALQRLLPANPPPALRSRPTEPHLALQHRRFPTPSPDSENVEDDLVGVRGVRRYPGDVYCGHGLKPIEGDGPVGRSDSPWLAICAMPGFAQRERDNSADGTRSTSLTPARGLFDRATKYFLQLERCMTPEGYVPRCTSASRPGTTRPRLGPELHIIAAQTLLNLPRTATAITSPPKWPRHVFSA